MDKNKKANAPDQDNIGYENTERRTDRDDREMNRLQTTDTDNDEGKPVDVKFEDEANKDEDPEGEDEDEVFGQL